MRNYQQFSRPGWACEKGRALRISDIKRRPLGTFSRYEIATMKLAQDAELRHDNAQIWGGELQGGAHARGFKKELHKEYSTRSFCCRNSIGERRPEPIGRSFGPANWVPDVARSNDDRARLPGHGQAAFRCRVSVH